MGWRVQYPSSCMHPGPENVFVCLVSDIKVDHISATIFCYRSGKKCAWSPDLGVRKRLYSHIRMIGNKLRISVVYEDAG
jgi:hypothetical protein